MEPEVSFVGLKIAPGKSIRLRPPPCGVPFPLRPAYSRFYQIAGKNETVVADYDDDCYETIHLTQVALGDAPSKGPHTVFVESDGERQKKSTNGAFLFALHPLVATLMNPWRIPVPATASGLTGQLRPCSACRREVCHRYPRQGQVPSLQPGHHAGH
jgi:hypothetical protein